MNNWKSHMLPTLVNLWALMAYVAMEQFGIESNPVWILAISLSCFFWGISRENEPNRVYETVTHLTLSPYHIRVWRNEAELGYGENGDLILWAQRNRHRVTTDPEMNMRWLIEEMEHFPRVVAVEVTCGEESVLLYPDWK